MLEEKHQRLLDVVSDGVARGFVEFVDFLAAYRLGFAEEQVVGVLQVAAPEPADVDVVILDPDVAEAPLTGVQRSDVCALLLFGPVADAGFYIISDF